MRLLLLADLHLGAPLPEWGETAGTRRQALRDALTGAVDTAMAGQAQAVLVAGDLFDRPDPDPDLVTFAWGELARLVESGITPVLLPGNFDNSFHSESVYQVTLPPEGVVVISSPENSETVIPLGDETLVVHGLSWHPGVTPEDPWSPMIRGEQSGIHLGLFHATLSDDGAPDVVPTLVMNSGALDSAGLDLIVVGRDHRPVEQRLPGGTPLVVPGSPVGLGPEETGERGFMWADFGAEGLNLSREPWDAPPVLEETIRLRPETPLAVLVERIVRRIGKAGFARVVLEGKVSEPIDLNELQDSLPPEPPREPVDRTEMVAADDGDPIPPVRRLAEERLHELAASARTSEEKAVLRMAVKRLRQTASEVDHAA